MEASLAVHWLLSVVADGLCVSVTVKDAVTALPSCDASEGDVAMTEVTPERQALYALGRDLRCGDLPVAAQLEYDRLRPAWERGEVADWG
jgi:hypothetical protein